MLALAPAALAQPDADDSDWRALAAADRAGDFRRAGELRLALGDFPGAEKDFQAALQRSPEDGGLLYLLAEARHERPEEALPYADFAAKSKDATAAARARANLLAGRLRLDLEDAAGAERSLKLALVDAPGDLDALHALVRLLRARKAEALVYAGRAERAAGAAPLWHRSSAYRYSARIWLELEEHERAAENFERALRLNPEDLDALGPLVRMKSRLAPARLAGLRRAALLAAGPPEAGMPASAAAPNDVEELRRLPVWQRADGYRAYIGRLNAQGRHDLAFAMLDRSLDEQSDSMETWRLVAALPPDARLKLNNAGLMGIYCAATEMRLALDDRAGAAEVLALALKHEPGHAWALRLQEALKK